jgi:hypothetical protein
VRRDLRMAWPVIPEAPKTRAVRGGVVVDMVDEL